MTPHEHDLGTVVGQPPSGAPPAGTGRRRAGRDTILCGQQGLWVRRGRPGLRAPTLQRWGARVFRRGFVRNLPQALRTPLDAGSRERLQQNIAADPQEALDHTSSGTQNWVREQVELR